MSTRLLIATAALSVTIACGGGSSTGSSNATPQSGQAAPAGQPAAGQQSAGQQQVTQGAQQTAQGAQQTTQGLQQIAQGFGAMAQGAAKPVDFEVLKALMPDVGGGWTRSNMRGSQVNIPFAMSNAEAHYAKGESSIQLNITDSALNQLILAPFTMFLVAGFEERSDDGYKKAVRIAGNPAFESWEKDNRKAEVTVVVGNRFVVAGEGRHVENTDVVRKVVEAVDLSKLATLK